MKRLALVLFLAVSVSGCGAIDVPGHCGGPTPEDSIDVTVTTVTLGDACGDAKAAPGLWAGDCASESPNCGICRASSVQLDISSRDHRDAAFTVIAVHLFDPNSGALVDSLTASNPTQWDGKIYASWNERVPSRTNVKAKYSITAPNWSRISGNGARLAAPQSFKTQVEVEIDGVRRTTAGPDAFREPEVAT